MCRLLLASVSCLGEVPKSRAASARPLPGADAAAALAPVDTADTVRCRLPAVDIGVCGAPGVEGVAGSGSVPAVRWKIACRWYWKRTAVPRKEGGICSGSCSLCARPAACQRSTQALRHLCRARRASRRQVCDAPCSTMPCS